jgi:flagellar assembly factor FliW
MKREIAQIKDFTPEYIVEEIKDQLTANPFVVRYDYERNINPYEVPTITITLELLVGKNPEVNKEELQKQLDRIKRI